MPVKKKASSGTNARKRAAKGKAAGTKKVTKKAAAKKAPAKKAATAKSTKKKTAAKKAPAKKKTTAKKTAARKTAAKKSPAKKAVTKKSVAKKTPARKTAAKKRAPIKPRAKGNGSIVVSPPLHGFEPYEPDRGEDYMSEEQLEHFRSILLAWKQELMQEVDRTVHHMKDEAANFPDPTDRATQESEFGLELRTRDRERKLIRKIDSALARIDDGTYGYCEETGEEIGLKRLEARPVATLTVEAQERRELAERQYSDRDDR